MTFGTIALAVTLGSIIGMTCIMVRECRMNNRLRKQLVGAQEVRMHLYDIIGQQTLKLQRNQPRDARGRFVKKGGA